MNIEYILILLMLMITNFCLWKLYRFKAKAAKDVQAERMHKLMSLYTRDHDYEYE